MRKVIYYCDSCHKEITQMVVFDATDTNLNERPTYCKACAAQEFTEWISGKLGTNACVLIVNPSLQDIRNK